MTTQGDAALTPPPHEQTGANADGAPRAENGDGLSIRALTVGDVFIIIRKHYQGFFFPVACQGWKARFIGKRCRRCREEDLGIYLAKAMPVGGGALPKAWGHLCPIDL